MTSIFKMADVNLNVYRRESIKQINKGRTLKGMQDKESIVGVRFVQKNPSLGITAWHPPTKPHNARRLHIGRLKPISENPFSVNW